MYNSTLKTLLTFFALLLSLWATAQIIPDTNGVVYVKTIAIGNGTGNSWANATDSLQDAINAPGTQQVWVAKGTYEVSSSSFILKNNVAVYGGFDPANGINDLSDARILPDPDNNQGSVLDGKNERPVVFNSFTSASPMDTTAKLDGFTITKGNGTYGGGFYNSYASPRLTNLVIRNNTASDFGGGIYNSYSSSVITHSVIKNNTATYLDGGGIYNNYSSPVISHTIIKNNTANHRGGGIYNLGSSPALTDVCSAHSMMIPR